MPCTKISDAHYKSDLVNPFSTLNSRDIMKINKRICGYKEKLFLKDKVIQDKLQVVDALSILHQQHLALFNQKLSQKNFKIKLLEQKYDEMLDLSKEQSEKIRTLEETQKHLRQSKSMEELEEILTRIAKKDKITSGSNPDLVEALDQNYKMQVQIRELENKCDTLKNYLLQNDSTYNYTQMKAVFEKLGNIFNKNTELGVREAMNPEKTEEKHKTLSKKRGSAKGVKLPEKLNSHRLPAKTIKKSSKKTVEKRQAQKSMEQLIKDNTIYLDVE